MDFLRAAWEARTPRERSVLAAGAVVLAALLGYQFAWSPLMAERERLRSSIVTLRVQAAAFTEDASEAEQLRGSANSRERSGTPLQTLRALAERNGMRGRIKSIAESPDGRLQVALEPAPYEGVVRWLGEVARDGALSVESIEMKRTNTPGMVQVESLVFKANRR
jgi:general secretion pathway protein M